MIYLFMKSSNEKTSWVKLLCGGLLVMSALGFSVTTQAISLSEHPKLQAVADELVAQGHYSQVELEVIFEQAEIQQSILEAMLNPAEYKFTWGKYRKLFLQADRIQQGVDFWNKYESEFARAEQEFGVPASIIAAIIGVESKFGKYKGKHKVLDSLVTLVVGFERRSKFFAKELKEFLLLSKDNDLEVGKIMGSYAGAVGFPQFIASSYRAYAVDFSGDGKTDLIDQPIDAIGSVANYFVKNGWLAGQPVTSQAHSALPNQVTALASRKRRVEHKALDLRELGAPISEGVSDAEKLAVLMLNANEVVESAEESGVYIVRAGDTACEVAERHNVSCKTLFKLNNLSKNGAIFRGQRLKLPLSEDHDAKDSKKASGREQAVANFEVYIVRAGDTACEIAENHNVSCKTLFKVNDLDKSGAILLGQKLKLPVASPPPVDVKKTHKVSGSKWEISSASQPSTPSKTSTPSTPIDDLSLPQPIYFFTHENFYVITRYNQSVLYAMAVYDLSIEIDKAKRQTN